MGCLTMHSVPVKRNELVRDTERLIALTLMTLHYGWTSNKTRRIPVFYSHHNCLPTISDGTFCHYDQIVIPSNAEFSCADKVTQVF